MAAAAGQTNGAKPGTKPASGAVLEEIASKTESVVLLINSALRRRLAPECLEASLRQAEEIIRLARGHTA